VAATSTAASREAFYGQIGKDNLAPLWEVLGALVPPAPRSVCAPVHWAYTKVLPHLQRSGEVISAEEAERRVLVLENPALRGESRITRSLYAGYQLLLPGEVAHSHRHTATAIRLVVDGRGAFTSVDGERTPMEPGDFIITPSWTFHDHGNPGYEPVVWMDGLDIRIVELFAAQFHEVYPEEVQPVTRSEGAATARYGSGLVPLGATAPFGRTSPIFNYPYARSRESLDLLSRDQDPDPHHGWKMTFINPLTGGHAMPTIAAFIQLLPNGFKSQPCRSTDGTIYSVVEGGGRVTIGSESFDFEPRDTFVVPSWVPVTLHTTSETVLFSFSDRPGQEAMGLWREARK
jgi:gentisate 1,2-dioxygenase